jgi:hypothetical protein
MNKEILIENLLELELTYNITFLELIQKLKDNSDPNMDIILLNDCIDYIDIIINETNEYLNTLIYSDFHYNYISNYINNLYNSKYKIINYLNKINEVDSISEFISDFNQWNFS